LRAQDARQRPAKGGAIVLQVTVTGERAHFIKGLKPGQFRVWEDDIPQKIHTFAEGGEPPVVVNEDGSAGPLADPEPAGESVRLGLDPETGLVLDNAYTISYYPDPSNQNEGYRKIKIEIVQDGYQRLRIRTKAGYRPRQRIR
jgi:hypothetical protein